MSEPATEQPKPPGRCVVTSWLTLRDTTDGTHIETTWDEWFATLENAPPYLGDMRHPGWSAAAFEPASRSSANVVGLSALVLDYDGGATIDEAESHWSEWFGIIHTTRSHTAESPCFRVIVPFTRMVTPDQYKVLWKWADDICKSAGHKIDPQTKDPGRFWFLPGIQRGHEYVTRRLRGIALDPDPILDSAKVHSIPILNAPKTTGADAVSRAVAYLSKIPGAIAGDSGHAQTWGAALAVVRGFKLDEQTAYRILSEHYNHRCVPPWSEKELRHKIDSATKEGRREWGYLLDRERPRLSVVQGTGTDGPAPQPSAAPQPLGRLFKRGDHVELADAVLQKIETSPVTFDDGTWWRYDTQAGVWTEIVREKIENAVTDFAGSWITTGEKYKPLLISAGTCKGVADVIRNTLVSRPNAKLFANTRAGIAFRDRFVTVENGEVKFHPHDPDNLARSGLPFDYDPLAHPQLDRFFADLFSDEHGQPLPDAAERVAVLQEFVGASLLGLAPSYQRCLVLYGTGNNGKSQLIDICKAAFPDGTVVSLPPQQWEERFRLPLLVGALANFVGEMPTREIAASETFKGVVVGDSQTAERKNRDAFTFRPRVGHMFASNSLPTSSDISAGFFRRFVILPLTRVFPESGAGVERDIGARIAREEKQAIAAWAVEGAARLQRQGGYTVPPSANEMKEQWAIESDSVRLFLAERTKKLKSEPGTGMKFDDLYMPYATWAKGRGFVPVNATTFGRRYTSAGYQRSIIQGRTRYYVRILDTHEY